MSEPTWFAPTGAATDYTMALLAPQEFLPSQPVAWPPSLRCDLVDVPLDGSCGVIACLDRAGASVCPIVQVGDRMVFLVSGGSTTLADVDRLGLPPGTCFHGTVDQFPPHLNKAPGGTCWVIPPEARAADLPSADTVVSALRLAYAEFRAAAETRLA